MNTTIGRAVTAHQVTEADKKLTIQALDEPGAGGAYHVYGVSGLSPHPSLPANGLPELQVIAFQQGPVENDTPNGITIEALLAICKHRLDCFQAGPYPSQYNDRALIYIEQAIAALQERTRARISAGVEGKMEGDPVEVETAYPTSHLNLIRAVIEELSDEGNLDFPLAFPLGPHDHFQRSVLLSRLAANFGFDEDLLTDELAATFDSTTFHTEDELVVACAALIEPLLDQED